MADTVQPIGLLVEGNDLSAYGSSRLTVFRLGASVRRAVCHQVEDLDGSAVVALILLVQGAHDRICNSLVPPAHHEATSCPWRQPTNHEVAYDSPPECSRSTKVGNQGLDTIHLYDGTQRVRPANVSVTAGSHLRDNKQDCVIHG